MARKDFIMSMLSDAQNVFADNILSVQPILPGVPERFRGIEIILSEKTNISPFVEKPVISKPKIPFDRLLSRYEFIIIRNAYLSKRANWKISNALSSEGWLLQDPFHRDGRKIINSLFLKEYGRHYSSILSKSFFEVSKKGFFKNSEEELITRNLNTARQAPTYFSTTFEVKKAIEKLLNNKGAQYDSKITLALEKMAEQSYGFLVDEGGRDIASSPYSVIQEGYPRFSEDVFNSIAENKRYSHKWASGEMNVVITTNEKDGILHGRPQIGKDKKNPVGLSLYHLRRD